MRKIILNLAITLDGFIEGEQEEMDWLVKDDAFDYGDILNDILSDKDAIFYGRVSYDKWGNAQPGANDTPKIKEAYKLMHSKQKYVFSKTTQADGTNAIFINSDIREQVLAIQQEEGKDIWLYGGAQIANTFLNLDLIDEFRLAVHPVLLGKGKPLFHGVETRHPLTLIDAKSYQSGVILMKYKADRK